MGGFVQDTGAANAVVIASPIVLADGVPFLVKFAATNTANVTIKVGNYPANPLVGIAGALNGGEIAAGGYGWVVYSSTLAGFVLISPVYGGALQVGTALQPKHAVQLAQVLPVAKISNFAATGTNQVISGSVSTALILTTEAFDDLNEYSTSTGKFTATNAGTYVFSATVHGVTTTVGRRTVMIFVNGSERYRLQENAQIRGDCALGGTSAPLALNAGDYVQVYYLTSVADTIDGFNFGGWRIK